MQRFHTEYPETIPVFCIDFQLRLNDIDYRINFTESEVDSVCDSRICRAVMTELTLPCYTFVSKRLCAQERCEYVTLIFVIDQSESQRNIVMINGSPWPMV